MRMLRGLTLAALCLFIWGCGDQYHPSNLETAPPLPTNPPDPDSQEPDATPSGRTDVIGSAQFGSQCPYGSFSPPQPVPLELWNCPNGLSAVELQESLPPIILQADCKLKTLSVRSMNGGFKPTAWEAMPDGSFYVAIDAGKAKLKDDGAGSKNCSTPMVAHLWGKMDCTDRDKAIIHVETVWWLNKTTDDPVTSSPLPSLVPSPSESRRGPGSGSSNSTPSPVPSVSPNPSGSPSISPTASPHPSVSRPPVPTPSRAPHHHHHHLNNLIDPPSSIDPASSNSACQLPTGCHFHNITQINQCS